MRPASNKSSAAARTLWLSELMGAIDEAQRLAWQLGVGDGRNAQALDLYVRLEIARAEVEALRSRTARADPADPHQPSTAFPDFGRPASRKA